ncbi:hypothetical protein MCUN1_003311 [Malassezia cuniculi]|uniref:PH domain-containing protein n=1 Tax=Malassezia cuniculi TaxID=948313 RepID=A0AAF0J7A9_9BASI|nr:hypothetical protein MCUN1_003311 [Malassezia cuniculi]
MDDDDSVLRTPSKGLLDDSALDSLIDASASLRVTDDSLADALTGAPDEPETPGPPESEEQVTAQLHELRQLNTLFENYEAALTSSITQVEERAKERVQELGSSLGGFRLLEALRADDRNTISKYLETVPKSGRVPQMESPLHLAVLCAEPQTIDHIIRYPGININQQDQNGDTPLHLALSSGRSDATGLLLSRPELDDTIRNDRGSAPVECISSVEIGELLQNARTELRVRILEALVDFEKDTSKSAELLNLVQLPRVNAVDLLVTNPETGHDVLQAAVVHKNVDLMTSAIRHGADPYTKDTNGKSAADFATDASTRALLHQLSSAEIVEQAKHSPTFRGFLGKWTNMVGGFKLRWFVLQDGVLSYYQCPEDEGRLVRGSTHLQYATIRTEKDPTRFEIISRVGKGSNKMYLRANDAAECNRWVQILEKSKRFHQNKERSSSEKSHARTASDVNASLAPPAVPSRTTSPAPDRVGGLQIPTVSQSARSSVSTLPPIMVDRGPDPFDDQESEADVASMEDSALDPSDNLPNTRELAVTKNLLNAYFDISLNAIAALETQIGAQQPHTVGTAVMELRKAMHERMTLWRRYSQIVEEREETLKRRLDREIAARRLWEDNITALEHQQSELTSTLQSAKAVIVGQRQELCKIKGDSAMPIRAESADDEFFDFDDEHVHQGDFSAAAAAAAGAGAGAGVAGAAAGVSAMQISEEPKSTEPESAAPQSAEPQSAEQEPAESQQNASSESAPKESESSGPQRSATQDYPAGGEQFAPYTHLRDRMPIRNDERPAMSLWSILKNNIGKDLTKISFPVSFNEPTSMLQRMAEDMEFSECLDAASQQSDSLRRIMYVAAFAMSNYSSTIGRIAKPFNPLLGETFEYVRPDRNYRYVSEQVSHHPPVSACYGESPTWEYMGCVDAKSKFLGRTFEIRPTGVAHVNLKVPKEWAPNASETAMNDSSLVLEHYSWNKVITSVSGFIVGAPTIDHYGEMVVVNHATGDKCILEFSPPSWRTSSTREIRGKAVDGSGKQQWEIAGRWGSQLVARRVGTGSGSLGPDTDTGHKDVIQGSSAKDLLLLWRNSEKPKTPFNLTPFAITLNSYPDDLRPWLPPTDCRQRPDLSAFESGRFADADKYKVELEQFQRDKRRRRETGELPPHKPRWFAQTVDEETRAPFWKPLLADDGSGSQRMNYWIVRDRVGHAVVQGDTNAEWPNTEHIFGSIGQSSK